MVDHAETANLKADDLDRMLEDSGIQLTQSQEVGGFNWRLVARSRDQDRAMGLLADRLLRSLFDPSLLEIQRLACRRQLERPEGSPHERLRQALTQDPASRLSLSSLKAITLQDLLAFRAKVFRPDRAILMLHGDLGLEQAKRLVLLNLGSWTVQEPPAPGHPPSRPASAPPPSVPVDSPRISVPGAGVRVQVVASRPGELTPEAAELLNFLVPGDMSLSPVQATMEDGCLVATLDGDVGTSGAIVGSLLHERLKAFRRRGFAQADLDRARVAWFARRSLDSLHPEAQMDRALTEALGHGVAEDRLKALTLDALNLALRDWLDPANLRMGASGDPGDLKSLTTP
jgi:predicted Zn-dependent peptidase